MASRSGRQGSISPETKELMESNAKASDISPEVGRRKDPPEKEVPCPGENNPDEGCRVCRRDEDHANLLLCEACNDEYHTYCLKPPLQSVPDDDWFCDKCKQLHSAKDDDGLDCLVSALPPAYTSRFGEIVWAAGGQGFGWWPACIYDPRLTVGGARQLARKNLGKRHLVYFFECHDAPFTVLGDNRLTKWEDGFLEEYDLGKVAKSGNKGRSLLFDKALHLAQMENDRPIELRMDWNHQGVPQLKIPKSKISCSVSPVAQHVENQQPKKKQKALVANEHVHQTGGKIKKLSRVSSSSSITGNEGQRMSHAVSRKHMDMALGSLIEPSEDGPLVCKILQKLPLGLGNSSNNGGLEFSNNVGFITLPSRQSATFECIRKAMESQLDNDSFPQEESKGESRTEAPRWKFYVPKLGPVSVKQEKTLGPVLEFLKGVTNDSLMGNGTPSSPLKIICIDC
ncbi:hypothetical protein HJC23_008981 [Cyclotella cryptica]|uniref:PHD-type domain-containing protein n=1 Tax=Cyclotella cryptica TaxID=29204 RepID=A0ABD3QZ05_9STRA|eukprot:CCRYP_000551-RA/>CCRYP_000551-RA protein AED:0.06 eAED:0.06 QI:207/1/1/1/1/1/3/407/454